MSDIPPDRSAPVLRFNGGRLLPPDPGAPLKHVIEEYKHRAQTVTCACGWHGSTSSPDGRPSEWTAHVTENRGKRF